MTPWLEPKKAHKPTAPTSGDPSYPSDQAAVVGTSATVLSYAYPGETAFLEYNASEEGDSRVLTGVNFQRDIASGYALGRAVAQKAIDKGQ
jgi:hypothetical protein